MARVLIIEDNPANLKLMVYLLRAFGHVPLEAPDGETGLRWATEHPDLILCDVQLPGMSGEEVARYLRSHPEYRNIPLVAVTALAMVGDRERIMAAGFDGYLAKPIDPETFIGQIEAFLQQPHAASPGEASPLWSATPAASGADRGAPEREQRILVVDNLPVHHELARSILEPFGYQVSEASGMEEGLRQARETAPDLIVSDICMGARTGFDLLLALKEDAALASIPVVLITSTRISDVDRARALALGAERFLVRPIEPEEFLREIAACLR